ncbi:hypothetical protein [Paraburkholderia sp. PGU16]|uniref:Cell wall hydrolase SleB domain-containing protein n=1 Tax=Paraburkholderia largidicola TaxID=3014751 RepID=A0A7I8BY66_9BURK|nr:hypothetical protein [Paraburkholderia sp. PGU16]BCF92900.1 hypothetical protein PPGU16_59670 [Paraburkholderia sp. PGU16]BEU26071.1 hypothetical protein PBP221_62110 [Paraburkholderia sp. 22B1P]
MPDIDDQTRKLAGIAYGEASVDDDPDEIGGIAFAVANRCRAWGGKTVDQLLSADPNYTYAVSDGNARFGKLMSSSNAGVAKDPGMSLAVEWARKALVADGTDPSGGGFWWDGLDFKSNYAHHPKVRDGFRYGSPEHNIFDVPEARRPVTIWWQVKNKKTGQLVNSSVRGKYDAIWVSTAAHGHTIFWKHDPDYISATSGKVYR